MPDHTCWECGATFTHQRCDHPDGDDVELYCLQCTMPPWSPDETGMEEEEP